jgi:outer membrane protein assembly factor BamE (lipoprotein component of BamABCDE complex)
MRGSPLKRRRPIGLVKPLLAVLVAAGLGGCFTTQTRIHGHLISEAMLGQVPVGASQEQVLLALGTPSTTSTVAETGEAYYYISQKTQAPARFMNAQVVDQRVVAVYFDKSKRVAQVANYGLQDGKVFDFIARKTPTAGREVSLIGQLLQGLGRPSIGL